MIGKKDLGLGQTQLVLHNPEEIPVYVGGYISIQKDGREVRRCELGIFVQTSDRSPACVYFTGEGYVANLKAEKDTN